MLVKATTTQWQQQYRSSRIVGIVDVVAAVDDGDTAGCGDDDDDCRPWCYSCCCYCCCCSSYCYFARSAPPQVITVNGSSPPSGPFCVWRYTARQPLKQKGRGRGVVVVVVVVVVVDDNDDDEEEGTDHCSCSAGVVIVVAVVLIVDFPGQHHSRSSRPSNNFDSQQVPRPVDRDRLVGLVVRRPPRERKIPGSNPACAGIFSGSSLTSDSKIGTPVATLPGAWRYRVSAGTGRPGVSIL